MLRSAQKCPRLGQFWAIVNMQEPLAYAKKHKIDLMVPESVATKVLATALVPGMVIC